MGALVAYLRRGNPNVQVFLPEEEPGRGQVARALAEFLVKRVQGDRGEEDASGRAGMLIATVNGVAVAESEMARALLGMRGLWRGRWGSMCGGAAGDRAWPSGPPDA